MRIFSKEVVHVKKATHKGALDLHIFFQGNENFIKSFDSKDRLWEGTQQHLSSSPGLLAEYRALRKEDTVSTSQSCTNMMKFMSQCTSSL